MMAQYIVVDPNVAVSATKPLAELRVFPTPTRSTITYTAPFVATELLLMDRLGRIVLRQAGLRSSTGLVDMTSLVSGAYLLVVRSDEREVRTAVVRE